MKCARCSAEIPAQSQFCLRCGTPVHATAVNPSGVMQPPLYKSRSNNRGMLLAISLLALAVIAVGAFMLRGALAQKTQQTAPTTLVQAPAVTAPSPLVQAPADTPKPAPTIQASAADAPPPTDVIDYLAFLKKVEISKKQLIHDQETDLTVAQTMLPVDQIKDYLNFDQEPGGPNGDQENAKKRLNDLARRTSDIGNQWNQLTTYFNTRTPPESCRDLQAKYYDQLGKIQAEIIQVYTILGKTQSDPTGALHDAEAMKGTGAEVDTAMKRADDALSDVCRQYHLSKDFDIGEGAAASLIR